MTWNYRIIDFGGYRALHEVFYDKEGRPDGYTEGPCYFGDDPSEPDGIVESLKMALNDIARLPVLKAADLKAASL